MKRLPLGDQTFSEIIEKNYLYADKTKYIFDLVQSDERNYFLSRPRRFGKTMLLSTMEELFTGGVGRFQGLWIEKSGYEFPSHPVIHLTLTTSSESPEILKSGLLSKLREFDHGGYLKDGDGVAYDIYFGKL
ncbi:MAG: AAA family ATPase, partial [Deltaproteobacteria bacterium]|nr:AAA family ATPase [Deltaproteobacteria bacterium]